MRLSSSSFLPRFSTLISGPRFLNVHPRLASTSSAEQPTPTPTPAPAPAPAPAREQAEEQGHPKPKRPYSQLQRNVFALYRKAYRLIRTKPEDTQYHFLLYLRHAFKHPSQGGAVGRRDFSAIEHLLRRGERMVEQVFGDVGVRDVHLPGYVIEEVQREQARRASEKEEEAQGKPKR
ncbi:unnamed protein product [Tilletia laevis]|uniref:Complex 1 LYR protein domain-containing protein n=4 Tax=Tilletia TaxID=13289 RepID=A0A8X7MXE9_9BASI|nr:hypothetical protein CF336_g2134 [Tilletia laevis]KAE8252779.1 hypothetical protein A4X06_0g1935 [Tilletia controversa]CAD6896416.1 unnamed protein product [Tilletia caries]CAD6897583.1 unnamed protein product [Tilletia laevis]CAD6904333.1 unnamed protein product [Tilletia controversa]